jgi:transcriptional antiterminator
MSLQEINLGQRAEAPAGPAFERHFSVQELSELWNYSEPTIREMFKDEEGVMATGEGERLHKRAYITLRIPESVVRRVHARLSTREKSSFKLRRAA